MQAVPGHSRQPWWFLWVRPPEQHYANHHCQSHQGPPCLPWHSSVLPQGQWTTVHLHRKQELCLAYEFEHFTTSLYWSCSNGKAEADIHDPKTILKKSENHLSGPPQNTQHTTPWSPLLPSAMTREETYLLSASRLKRATQTYLCRLPYRLLWDECSQRGIQIPTWQACTTSPLPLLPLGQHAYAKPHPSQWGSHGSLVILLAIHHHIPTPNTLAITCRYPIMHLFKVNTAVCVLHP